MFDLKCGIQLRAFQTTPTDDLEGILSAYNNTEVAPQITERFIIPRGQKLKDEFKELIETKAEMFCTIETTPPKTQLEGDEKHEPRYVGFTALWAAPQPGQRYSKYSIVLLPEFWNKGYGQVITKFMVDYAFLNLNMHRISLEVYEGNDRATAVYKKCGFVEEGRLRKVTWVNGAWRDIHLMGILAEEWTELRKLEQQELSGMTPRDVK
ncbi:acyl-CoA N-acyltransferase [Gymnopilus junonius]|uniref:Acyl-CoA N-acyltransferase n=1 Tax=Gymnopilus junonius TaxID=109634 RepID=A0A9P5NPT0_GYMJU|nr:acyl-CoA N-acyltransferase [Gymnopilus junonius]